MIPRCLLALAVIVGLAGCTAGADHPSDTRRPATGRTNATHSPVGIPDGVVGSASITSVSGAPLGTATIVKTGDQWVLKLPQFDLGDSDSVDPVLADSPFSPTACGSDNVWEAAFLHQDGLPMSLDIRDYSGDPSFFTTLLLVRYGGATQPTPDASGCIQPILATGPITWTIPLQRPWVHPSDKGVAAGASGSVTLVAGEPKVYTTAKGDAWNAIASRFGISASDLTWLNPKRLGGGTPGEAYAQQLLNLDPTDRGDSESRRPH